MAVAPTLRDHLLGLAKRIHGELVSARADSGERPLAPAEIRLLARNMAPLCTDHEIEALVTMVNEQLWGLGPLEALLGDPHISEVMVNGPGPVWVERHGEVQCTDIRLDDDALRLVIDRIVGPLGLRLDRIVPFVDARLTDGSRVHIAIPPMALDGPYVTIRRFAPQPWSIEAFTDSDGAELLRTAVRTKQSALISGATGSGKTSLLNAVAGELDSAERVVTIEDAAELQLGGDHVVRLEARPANAEGIGEVTIRALVRNALRMRPDRLVVGEVRGAEAFDMVQAMNTGHEGSLSTCHANGPVEAIDRLVSMVLMSDVAMPSALARSQVLAALSLVVHLRRADGGHRRVDAVLAVTKEHVGDALPDSRWLVRDGAITSHGRAWIASKVDHCEAARG